MYKLRKDFVMQESRHEGKTFPFNELQYISANQCKFRNKYNNIEEVWELKLQNISHSDLLK
jgi:hypothetical protein